MSRPALNIYKFLSPTDNQLLAFLIELSELEKTHSITVQVAPGVNIKFSGSKEDITKSLAKNGKGRQVLQASFTSVPENPRNGSSSFTFNRGETVNNALQASTNFSEILFTRPEVDKEYSSDVANLIEKHFKSSASNSPNELGDELGLFVTQLAEVATGIAATLASAQINADAKAQERINKLDEQSEALRNAAEAERLELQKIYDEKSDELEQREAELNNARARSERRGLRKSINDGLKDSLANEISPRSARFARYPIVIVSIVGLAFSLFFAFLSFDQFATLIGRLGQTGSVSGNDISVLNGAAINWLFASLLLRGSIGLAAATFFGFYLIRYFKNLELTANRRALDLERYLFDIDRASWVIETIMELRDEEGISTIPDPWLMGATHNLFGSSGTDIQNKQDPLEALGEILASGAKLKVGNGASELEIQPKAAKKIVRNSSN